MRKRKSTRSSWWWTTINRKTKQQNKRQGTHKDKLRENINSGREEKSVKPQQRAHSNRLRWHKIFNSSNVFSMFSKERRFRSNQIIHITHPGIKFQILELCFPSHWCQQDNKPAVDLGITQCTPKAWSMRDHREWVTGQWSKRWSTDSLSPQHIQHRFTTMRSPSIRLSKVRIRLCAAVHKKKATRLGIFGFHTPFQGNKRFGLPWITW